MAIPAAVDPQQTKRALTDKANARIVIYVSIAVFVVMFSLIAIKTLVSQAAYQNRLLGKKGDTVVQLKADINATDQLKQSYDSFVKKSNNVLGVSSTGSGPNEGNNAKIVLDALPSSYDFPGLTTSLQYLLSNQGAAISSITGTDDEVAQSANQSSTTPQPVTIPFSVAVTGDYASMQNVVNVFGRSIRPMQIQTISISGSSNQLTMNITAQTFYQPAKTLNIKKVEVK